jgi:hypothetical protein
MQTEPPAAQHVYPISLCQTRCKFPAAAAVEIKLKLRGRKDIKKAEYAVTVFLRYREAVKDALRRFGL